MLYIFKVWHYSLYTKKFSFPEGMLWSIVLRLKDFSIHSNNRRQMTTMELKNKKKSKKVWKKILKLRKSTFSLKKKKKKLKNFYRVQNSSFPPVSILRQCVQVFLPNPYQGSSFTTGLRQLNANLRQGIRSHKGALAVTPLIQLKLTHKYIHRQGKKDQYKPSGGGAGKLDLSTELFTAALSWISFHKSRHCTLG